MNILEIFKSSLMGNAQTNHIKQVAQTSAPAPDMKIVKVLDKAVDVLESDGHGLRADGPSPKEWLEAGYEMKTYPPSGFAPKPSAEEIKAAQIRQEIRAQTKELNEGKLVAAKDAQVKQAEAEKRVKEVVAQKVDSWEERFKSYGGNSGNMVINRPLLKTLLDSGKLHDLRARCAGKVAPLLDAWDVAFEARAKQTRAEFKRQLLAGMAENERRLNDGNSDLLQLPDEKQFEKTFATSREQCKQRQAEISKQFNPALLEMADGLQLAARALASETIAAEQSQAESFGARFEPSCVLKVLFTAGFGLRTCVEHNHLASRMCSPRTTLYGLLDPEAQWK